MFDEFDYSLNTAEVPTFDGFGGEDMATGGGTNWATMAKFVPQIGSALSGMFGGSSQQAQQGGSFIPMQNAQLPTTKMVNPILDRGIARKNTLYDRLMGVQNA